MMETLDKVEVSQDFIEVEIPTDDVILIDSINGYDWGIPEINTDSTQNVSEECLNIENEEQTINTAANVSPVPENRVENSSDSTTKNIKITKLTALYNCKLCKYNTLKREAMTEHIKSHGIKSSREKSVPKQRRKTCEAQKYIPCPNCTHKCPHCSFFSRNMPSLKIHMRIHLKKNPYKCVDCDFHAKDLKELAKHYGAEHARKSVFICEVCGFKTCSKYRLDVHRRTHDEESD